MRNDHKIYVEKEASAVVLRKYGEFFKKQFQNFNQICNHENGDENKTYLPLKATMEPNELIPITDYLTSDNMLMTKMLSVLSSLCIEIVKLKQEACDKHFCYLSAFDEYSDSDTSFQIEPICQLSAFVTRCVETLRNIFSQVFAIFNEGIINLNGIQLHYIINHIGELFTILVLLEQLISNTSLAAKWRNKSKSLKVINHHGDITDEKFGAMKNAIHNITAKLMNDDIVQKSLQDLMTLRKCLVGKKCHMVANEFIQYLKQAFTNLEKHILEKPNTNNAYKCIKINALFVLSSHLFGSIDKKAFKSLMELNIKAHSIYVTGTTVWFPEQFLQRYAPSQSASYSNVSQSMFRARQAYISAKKSSLVRDMTNFQAVCTQWILSIEESFSEKHHKLNATEISFHAKILLEGLDIASNVNNSVLTLINLHVSLGIPLSKSMLMSLFEVIDMLKCLQNAVTRNSNQIINSVNMTIQHLVFQATSSILEVKKNLMTDKNYVNKRLDELTCLVIAERSLKGAATIERNIAANIALSFVPDTTYLEDSYVRLGMLLEKVQTLSNFMRTMNNLCNCSWMLWHQHVLPIYFDQNFTVQLNVIRLKYFLMVLEDCARLLHETDKLYGKNRSQEFMLKVKNIINDSILNTTSQNIETNLRLHIHSHLQLDVVNPFSFDMAKKLLLLIDNFRIQCIYISVVPSVEHYLSTMFYNLTTVVLSDWKTYGEMRQMAKFKFNLKTVQDNLPTQTLEQGLDVLEIMRNIHIFVSKYLYNLNNQIFIEKSSSNKHLNSINIKHIANSIRTHGTGIMNTTVNFTYQFLKKKFFTFSQFMYDEHIKSRLIKDLLYFKEIADINDKMYPYRNAEKFNKGIKVLGCSDDGQSYLDLFRDLISQIGNAMGYVRMIRSGGRHCCSDATVFMPSVVINKYFNEMCEEDNLGRETITSAKHLDDNIEGLITNFLQGTEYFKLLVDVFAPVFRNPKNVHLKNFFIIVPPLTLNFVEHMILSKDKMTKKNKLGAFTDDGFAMGVAYILKLLDQDSSFEALHWFDSVKKHINEEKIALNEQKTKGPPQLQQALALTEKKIKTVEEEYRLFYYSLTSARIFFR